MDRPIARRTAGIVFTIALLTLLVSIYVALVYHGDFSYGASWIVELEFGEWIALFVVLFALYFLMLLVLFAVSRPSAEPASNPDVQVECAQCERPYVVEDTGQRPMFHVCPHCAHTNVLDETPVEPQEELPETAPPATVAPPGVSATPLLEAQETVVEREEAGVLRKFLVLRCGACSTQFETPYSTQRPLVTECANCGRKGILRGRAEPTVKSRGTTEIEGIGHEYAKRLAEQGVLTIDDLRHADATALGVSTGIPSDTIRQWQGMAELMEVKGIGPQYSELLVKSGIASVDDLRNANPDDLLKRIHAAVDAHSAKIQGNTIGKKTVKGWINAAKKSA